MLRPEEARLGTSPAFSGVDTMVKTPGISLMYLDLSASSHLPKVASVTGVPQV